MSNPIAWEGNPNHFTSSTPQPSTHAVSPELWNAIQHLESVLVRDYGTDYSFRAVGEGNVLAEQSMHASIFPVDCSSPKCNTGDCCHLALRPQNGFNKYLNPKPRMIPYSFDEPDDRNVITDMGHPFVFEPFHESNSPESVVAIANPGAGIASMMAHKAYEQAPAAVDPDDGWPSSEPISAMEVR